MICVEGVPMDEMPLQTYVQFESSLTIISNVQRTLYTHTHTLYFGVNELSSPFSPEIIRCVKNETSNLYRICLKLKNDLSFESEKISNAQFVVCDIYLWIRKTLKFSIAFEEK